MLLNMQKHGIFGFFMVIDNGYHFYMEPKNQAPVLRFFYYFFTLINHGLAFYPILFVLFFEWRLLHVNISKLQHFNHFKILLTISIVYDIIGRIYAIIYLSFSPKHQIYTIIFVILFGFWILFYALLTLLLLFLRNYAYNSYDYVKNVIDETVKYFFFNTFCCYL